MPLLAQALLVLVASVIASSVAGAASFTATQTALQTASGQDFDLVFDSVPASDGVDGIFTIHARGDYQAANATEYLNWDLDSMGIGSAAGPPTGGATILVDNNFNDVEWTQSFLIGSADLSAMTADGIVHALLDLNLDDFFAGVNHLDDTEFVSVTLTYPTSAIPEPSAGLLFIAGFALVGRSVRGRTARRSGRATI